MSLPWSLLEQQARNFVEEFASHDHRLSLDEVVQDICSKTWFQKMFSFWLAIQSESLTPAGAKKLHRFRQRNFKKKS